MNAKLTKTECRNARNMGDKKETIKTMVEECLRDFADWIYKQLENEYDYRTSEEACREAIVS